MTEPLGLADLIGALTSVVGAFEPLQELANTVQDALLGVWTDFLGTDAPPESTNWDAYTHEELHDMLFKEADISDVCDVASEWGKHGAALAAHAEQLREQQTALQSHWQGPAAEQAADLLGQLRERISAISTRADTIQQATLAAADALAYARQTMPPPGANPFGSLPQPPAAPTLAIPGTDIGPTFDAMSAGQSSMFFGSAMTDGQKAQAVQVMQRYESNLRNSGHQIRPPGATDSRSYQVDGAMAGTTSVASDVSGGAAASGGKPAGESWRRLVGGGLLGGLSGGGATATPGSNPMPLGPGGMAGIGAWKTAPATVALAEPTTATRAPAGTSGFVPASAAAKGSGDQDEEYRSPLPTVDQQLFTDDRRACAPVIGL